MDEKEFIKMVEELCEDVCDQAFCLRRCDNCNVKTIQDYLEDRKTNLSRKYEQCDECNFWEGKCIDTVFTCVNGDLFEPREKGNDDSERDEK